MWQEQAEQFLKISEQFRLGDLPTEQQNPRTLRLSELAKTNLNEAIDTLLAVERSALDVLLAQSDRLDALALDIEMTLDRGGRIFFCGCGATGRLSLSLERLWRELVGKNDERVFSFMAGGDYALVHSIENFEDFPEYGARQLTDLGFADGDLLISTTEGGETPFVIGATLEAAKISSNRPYFLYCNPDRVLTEKLERCRQVIYNDRIKKYLLK